MQRRPAPRANVDDPNHHKHQSGMLNLAAAMARLEALKAEEDPDAAAAKLRAEHQRELQKEQAGKVGTIIDL